MRIGRKMHRWISIPIRDEREDEEKVEENERVETILNPEEERFFRAMYKIGKRPKFEVPTFLRILNLEDLINWINEIEALWLWGYWRSWYCDVCKGKN